MSDHRAPAGPPGGCWEEPHELLLQSLGARQGVELVFQLEMTLPMTTALPDTGKPGAVVH